MNDRPRKPPLPEGDEPADERFVRRVVAALVEDRRRRNRFRLAAAAALLFFFFAGAGQRVFTPAGPPTTDETYAGLVAPSPLDGLLPD